MKRGRGPAGLGIGAILLSGAMLVGCDGQGDAGAAKTAEATAPVASGGETAATLSMDKLRAFARARDAVVLLKDGNRCTWAYAGEDSANCWQENAAIKAAMAKEGLTVDEFLNLQKAWMEASAGFGSAGDVAFVKLHEAELHQLQPGDDGLSRGRKTGG